MLTVAIASVVLAIQNPLPPSVTLPPGWHLEYSVANGRGALIGPDAEEISFPAYVPTGYVAEVIQEMDGRSLFLRAMLDGRLVNVAVDTNGLVAVSYPPLKGIRHSDCFDYWTQSGTTRHVAKAIMICLTRLDVLRETDRDPEHVRTSEERFSKASVEYPFASLSVHYPFRYRVGGKDVGFELEEETVVKIGKAMPSSSNWIEISSLLGGELKVAEDTEGKLWASYALGDGKANVFMATNATRQTAALVIFAALNYQARFSSGLRS